MGRPRKLDVTPYYSEADGYWHAWPTIDGERWHRRAKDPAGSPAGRRAVEKKVRELQDELAAKKVAVAAAVPKPPGAGRYTVHEWLRYWLEHIVFPNRSYNTHKDNRHVVESMIIPHLEDVPLPDLEAEHVEKMLARLRTLGSADKPYRAYDRLRTALNAAVKRPRETGLLYNPIKAVTPPERPEHEVEPLTIAEVKQVLTTAAALERNAARWTVAMALGLRQGEVLALTWDDVDLERGILWVRTNTYRRKWLHGCDDAHACGAKFHRPAADLCPGSGKHHDRYHRKGCPAPKAPCAAECVEHAAQCPEGHGGVDADGTVHPGGRNTKDPKSRAGKRLIKMPGPLVAELRAHRAIQDRERLEAGDRWQNSPHRPRKNRETPTDLVFATQWGHEVNEREDWGQFVALLERAGVRRTRLHDSRHFAATMLLLKRIDPAVVMSLMGWSSPVMLRRYQHVLDEMRAEAAEAVTGALWDVPDGDSATATATAKITNLDAERLKRR